MEIYPYQIENGHLLIQLGKIRALDSTGTTDSMCSSAELAVAGKVFKVKQQTLRMSVPTLSTEIDTRLDALIGADILSMFDYRINPFRKELMLSTEETHPYGYAAHIHLYRGVPIVSIWVDSKEAQVFFNTGSRLTYLVPEIACRFPLVGKTRAFYPGIGWWETPLYRILIWMSGNDVELDVGLPPDQLLTTLQLTHTLGVIGCDIFDGPGVFLASRRREVIWFWHDY